MNISGYQKSLIVSIVIIGAILLIFASLGKFSTPDESADEIRNCGEGTVFYDEGDLCWQRGVAEISPQNWQEANDYCENLTLADRGDWRLPTSTELKSIVDKSFLELTINPKYFDGTKPKHYWASTEYSPGFHDYVHFETGYQGFAQDFNKDYGIRCVRQSQII